MEEFLKQINPWVVFGYTTGVVSIIQILELLFTKNIPWLFRLIRSTWRSVRRRFAGSAPTHPRKLILNFSGHPVLSGQQQSIQQLMHWQSSEVIDVSMGNVPEDNKFVSAIEKAINKVELSPEEWQSIPFVVIPAGYSAVWTVIQAVLHGRLGHFPDVVRIRPSPPLSAEKFEVAEILNLHEVRHQARAKRQ